MRVRWVAPVVAVCMIALAPLAVQSVADAAPGLAPLSAQQLLTDVVNATPVPLQGEVTQTANLGLADLGSINRVDHQRGESGVRTDLGQRHASLEGVD